MALKIKRRVAPLDENHKRQRQITVIAIFLSVALFFAGYHFGSNRSSNSKTTDTKKTAVDFDKKAVKTQVTDLGPKEFDLVIPTGYAKSEAGAKKAGATYVESWPQLLLADDYDVAAAINYVTTVGSIDLRKSLASTITSVRESLAGGIANQTYHQSVPLKIKVNSSDSSNVSLTIWSMELWVSAGKIEPQATFDFQDLKLTYVDNDWKITSWVTTPGSTPEWQYRDEPLDSINFLGSLSNFEEYKR